MACIAAGFVIPPWAEAVSKPVRARPRPARTGRTECWHRAAVRWPSDEKLGLRRSTRNHVARLGSTGRGESQLARTNKSGGIWARLRAAACSSHPMRPASGPSPALPFRS